MNITYNKESLY